MKAKISLTHQIFFKFLLIPLIAILSFSCAHSPDTESPLDSRLYIRLYNGNSMINLTSFNLEENKRNLKDEYLGPIKKPVTKIRINKNISSYKLKVIIRTYAKNSSGNDYLLDTYSILTSRMGVQEIITNNQKTPLDHAMIDIQYLE